jgi:hypothetical protein
MLGLLFGAERLPQLAVGFLASLAAAFMSSLE